MPRRFWVLLGVALLAALSATLLPTALAFILIDLGYPPSALGYVMAAQVIGIALASSISGALPTKFQARVVIGTAFALAIILQVSTGFLIVQGPDVLWLLVITQGAIGFATGCVAPSSRLLLVELVSSESRQRANGLMQGVGNVVGIAGPAIAGIILGAGGRVVFFWLSSLALLFAAVGSVFLPKVDLANSGGQKGFWGDAVAGYKFVAKSRLVRPLLGHLALVTMVLAVVFVLGPLDATQREDGVLQWSVAMAGVAAGGIVGSLVMSAGKNVNERVVKIRWWSLGLFPAPYLVLGSSLIGLAAVAIVVGLTVSVINVLVATELQDGVPKENIGSVFAAERFITVVSRVVPYSVAGLMVAAGSITVSIATALFLIAIVAFGPLRRSRARMTDHPQHRTSTEPHA